MLYHSLVRPERAIPPEGMIYSACRRYGLETGL
jgi:hypothetical protein